MLTSAQKSLLYLLQQHTPADAREATTLRFALTYVELEPVIYDRRTVPVHVTGAAVVVDPARARLLLCHDEDTGAWGLITTHDAGPQNAAVSALHEAMRLTGDHDLTLARPLGILDLELVEVPTRGEERAHRHLELRFLVHGSSERPVPGPRLRWVELEEEALARLDVPGADRVVARLKGLPRTELRRP